MLNAITIKFIKYMLDKIEFSRMLKRPRLISTQILGDLSLATKIKQQKTTIKKYKKILRGGKRMASCCPGGHLPQGSIAMATGLICNGSRMCLTVNLRISPWGFIYVLDFHWAYTRKGLENISQYLIILYLKLNFHVSRLHGLSQKKLFWPSTKTFLTFSRFQY